MDREKYIAMDVHQASISVAVRDAAGKLIVESIVEKRTFALRRPDATCRAFSWSRHEQGRSQ
jgi:hypothetical protein